MDKTVTLLLTGDVMIGEEFLKFKKEKNVDYEYPFRSVKKYFEEPDIVFGNLDCTLARSKMIRAKGPNLYSPPESVNALKYLNFRIVSLGNNHINDFGEEGITKTKKILKENGILSFGAGKNLKEANKEVFVNANGLEVVFLGYTTDEMHVRSIIATSNTAGCVFYDIKKIGEDIERVKQKSDVICVSLHWGYEYYHYPSPHAVNLAHQIIEAGANIVIGHHPHVIQGIERYKHGIIFYSLGNFFFPDYYIGEEICRWPEESKESIIVKLVTNSKEIEKVDIIPVYLDTDCYKMCTLSQNERMRLLPQIDASSKKLQVLDYVEFWNNYTQKIQSNLKKIELTRLWRNITTKKLKINIRKISIRRTKQVAKLLLHCYLDPIRFCNRGKHK